MKWHFREMADPYFLFGYLVVKLEENYMKIVINDFFFLIVFNCYFFLWQKQLKKESGYSYVCSYTKNTVYTSEKRDIVLKTTY